MIVATLYWEQKGAADLEDPPDSRRAPLHLEILHQEGFTEEHDPSFFLL